MRAIEENGIITIYEKTPSHLFKKNATYSSYKDALISVGLYRVIEPSYLSKMQSLGDIYFDKENKVFTYPVIDIDFSTEDIDKLKDSKISKIKLEARDLLQPTDWYVIRQAERSVDIPDQIASYRLGVLNKSEEFESDINGLSSYLDVATYNYSF